MAAMDRLVTVARRDMTARNALNEPVAAFADVGRVYAAIRQDSGAEAEAGAQARAVGVYVVRVRANGLTRSVTTHDRVRWAGAVHQVQSTAVVSDGRGLIEWRCVRLTDLAGVD
jgi:head-tail adaptor